MAAHGGRWWHLAGVRKEEGGGRRGLGRRGGQGPRGWLAGLGGQLGRVGRRGGNDRMAWAGPKSKEKKKINLKNDFQVLKMITK
jgi:hypothetical protein